jgi:hypothetical protein
MHAASSCLCKSYDIFSYLTESHGSRLPHRHQPADEPIENYTAYWSSVRRGAGSTLDDQRHSTKRSKRAKDNDTRLNAQFSIAKPGALNGRSQ